MKFHVLQDDLIEQTKAILFTSQGRHEILVEAIGMEEHPGRVCGLGRGIDFKAYFGRCQSSTEKMSKREVEEIVTIKLGEQRDKLQ